MQVLTEVHLLEGSCESTDMGPAYLLGGCRSTVLGLWAEERAAVASRGESRGVIGAFVLRADKVRPRGFDWQPDDSSECCQLEVEAAVTWRRYGALFRPEGDQNWARTHALLPTAEVLGGSRLRVYFASMDAQKLGRVGSLILRLGDEPCVEEVAPEPVLDLGPLGCFDDSGVTPSCVVRDGERRLLFYIGWQRAERVPYMLFTGLAEGRGERFERLSSVPVLDRIHSEPYSRGAPCVVWDGTAWRAYYWSCSTWSETGGQVHYNNDIRLLRSDRADHWEGAGDVVMRAQDPDVYSEGRPWVLRDASGWHMWFSSRSHSEPAYRISYAFSEDGVTWTRSEAMALDPSGTGWDSEMTCYPCVVDVGGRRWMLYNGNGMGETGLGLAEWLDPEPGEGGAE